MHQHDIFRLYEFNEQHKAELDRDGHFILPSILTPQASEKLTESLSHIQSLNPTEVKGHEPNHYAAEYDQYLENLIAHPQMLELARKVLGSEIRYDHCVSLNRPSGNPGMHWHSHSYAEDNLDLGFVRIFFYVNGFDVDDGGLKVVPGSHLYRDPTIHTQTDEELQASWMADKTHPMTGEPLEIASLSAPAGTVVLMWTHAAHAVSPKKSNSDPLWAVVYAYRNPGLPSVARWITEEFEKKPIAGADGLMSLDG